MEMAIELKVPEVGESITEGMLGEWLKSEGDWVDQDEPVVTIETDKVNVEIPAPVAGKVSKILKKEGDDVRVGEVIGYLEAAEKPAEAAEAPAAAEPAEKPAEAAKAPAAEAAEPVPAGATRVMPAAQRALADARIEPSQVPATGPGGRLLKEDVLRYLEQKPAATPAPAAPAVIPAPAVAAPRPAGVREEEAVPLTPLRKRVAERMVAAQQTAALLTTFNEVDMSRVIALRKQHQESFLRRYGVKLGFMSFFVKAAIEALKQIPGVNAELRGDEIVYRNYYDIGVAVGGGKGLVVPIIRNAERLSFAEVEMTIADLAGRAREGKLQLEELQGGTFTISNGGIYGSLLSTPIVNPPQSGILGMHKIQERPVAIAGEVAVRPMMYLALTYDHRIVDGREAVSFLVRIKECIEDPTRILLEV